MNLPGPRPPTMTLPLFSQTPKLQIGLLSRLTADERRKRREDLIMIYFFLKPRRRFSETKVAFGAGRLQKMAPAWISYSAHSSHCLTLASSERVTRLDKSRGRENKVVAIRG